MTTYININGDLRDASSLNVPQDRTFRGAWQFDGDAVEVNMTAAKTIHKDNLRTERAPEMGKLDVEFMRGLEQGVDVSAIAANKQALRDITKDARLDAATTPDVLKALDLVTLLGE
jgi:hypothetical protein